MEFTTDFIKKVSRLLISGLEEHFEGQGDFKIADIESTMREALRQVGSKSLGAYLTAEDGVYPAARIPCSCGSEATYRGRRPAKIVSVFGRVEYRRAYYLCPACKQGQHPLDERMGLEPGQVTAGLASLLGVAGVQASFEEAREIVKRFLLVEVCANTVRNECQCFGRLQASREKEWISTSQDAEVYRERQRTALERPKRVYGSLDGANAPMKEGWREMKTGCWYEVERVPKQRVPPHRRDKVGEMGALRAKEIKYYCDLERAPTFGDLVWATGCQQNVDLAEEVVFVADGAAWIWNLVDFYYPDAVQIVDWFHAEEYLPPIAERAFEQDQEEQTRWLEQAREDLWEGRVDNVITACQELVDHPRAGPEAQKADTYYTNNRKRLKYAEFRRSGYMIGSGTVESACKQIVTNRLKRSGARWTEDGATETAKARAAWLSGQWDQLAAMRGHLSTIH
jgi:hypothetical protein